MFLQAQAIPLRQKSGKVGVYRMRSGAVVRKTNVGPAERVVEDASSAALRSGSRAQSGGRADETQSNGSVVSFGQPPAPKNGTGRGAPAGMNEGSGTSPSFGSQGVRHVPSSIAVVTPVSTEMWSRSSVTS